MLNRRQFLKASAALAALGCATGPRVRPDWKVAIGLNGFSSGERTYKKRFPIEEVAKFGQKEGFDGVELVRGWPGPFPDPEDRAGVAELRSFWESHNLKIFSIQTGAGGAFQKDEAKRKAWLEQFDTWARLAGRLGCECIGIWPGGGKGDQTLEEARGLLVESLREAAKIVERENLLASVEIEPPFEFRTIEDIIEIVRGVGHPRVKGMYDPSHFDQMNGGRGRPEEMLERFGPQNVGYVHLTDTDGTLYGGTSRHLPCGEGHVDIPKSLDILARGGFRGWIMIDAWKTPDPYHTSRAGLKAVWKAQGRKG